MHHTTNESLAIIMAAGKGTRMRSPLPKVLHPFRGRPMIASAVAAANVACDRVVVVVGHGAQAVQAALPSEVDVALQHEQRGTGHAVLCGLNAVTPGERSIVVIPGDHPRVSARSIVRVMASRSASGAPMAMATVTVPDFSGERASFADFGRVVRDPDGEIAAVIEKKDGTDGELAITEVNVSCYCFDERWLRANIALLDARNAASELYLTGLIALAFRQGTPPVAVPLDDYREGFGVNSPEQLAIAETA